MKTQRGFVIRYFPDVSGELCSLQKSSSAEEPRIWLGADKLCVKELKNGWRQIKFPLETVGNNRMHLNQAQAKTLAGLLMHFAETGEVPEDE